MFTSAPFGIDDVTLFTSYVGLFGLTQCDVKIDFKSSFVAKRHRIFLRTFICLLGHINLSLYRKIVSVGISSTPNVSLTSLTVVMNMNSSQKTNKYSFQI